MGFGGFAVICIVYFLLYKLSLQVNHVGQNERTAIYFNPIGKLKFLFTRAVSSSFHFNYIFNEKSIPGLIVYSILFIAWIIAVFTRQKTAPFLQRIKYLLIIFLFFVLIYFPSLIVKENFASNRTLFALNMAVFFVVVYEVLKLLFTKKRQTIFVLLLSLFFIVNAWYNFNKLFLQPVKKEYTALSTFMLANYRNEIHTVYFIQPEEDFFVRKYGITRSWDEFGVPSSFFGWVPEFLVKQLVFEKTGDRSLADKIVVQHWIGQSGYKQSGVKTGEGILLVDAENILTND
jgi:hypothetical protein